MIKELLEKFIFDHFGVSEELFLESLISNPSADGYIIGAVSETLLKHYLESNNFETVRIKEKPSGGNDAKNEEARGDFYIRKRGSTYDEWLVIESKGLKSNSEFRGSRFDSPEKLIKYLKKLLFDPSRDNESIYQKGYAQYSKAKTEWEKKHPHKSFPPFKWTRDHPGPLSVNLDGIWKDLDDLTHWAKSLDKKAFSEKAYRNSEGAITVLETHKPSKRIGKLTGINQAAPLVNDFNILCVDLFLRVRKHLFVFANAEDLSHSPTSPEHLYQNYTIDILVPGRKNSPIINPPWFLDITDCINHAPIKYRKLDPSQIDNR